MSFVSESFREFRQRVNKNHTSSVIGTGTARDFLTTSSAVENFDSRLFWRSIFSILFFPFSLIFTRDLRVTMASIPFVLFWTYLILFTLFENHSLSKAEPLILFTTMILVAADNAVSAADPTADERIGTFFYMFKVMSKYSKRCVCCDAFARLRSMIQVSTVKPVSVAAKKARKALTHYGMYLSAEVPQDSLSSYSFLDYDTSPLKDERDFTRDIGTLGLSYKLHLMENPGNIPLEAVADQLVWVTSRRSVGSRASTLVSRMTLFVLGSVYTLSVSLLPFLFRVKNDHKHVFHSVDFETYVLSILYIVIALSTTAQITGFFVTMVEVYKRQYYRMNQLTKLFSREECRFLGLPVLNFSSAKDVFSWVTLRDYVSNFSRSVLDLYAARMVLVGAYMVSMFVYIVIIYVRGEIYDEGIFTTYVIITFVIVTLFILIVLIYASLANNEMDQHAIKFAGKVMGLSEFRFLRRFKAVKSEADPTESLAEAMLTAGLPYLQERKKIKWFGQPLNGSSISFIFTLGISVLAALLPVALETFGVDLGYDD